MDIFVQVIIEGNITDGAVSQKVTRALEELGLTASLEGKKGVFSLPRGTFAGTFPAPGLSAKQAVTQVRSDVIDQLSARLDASGFVGSFFMSVAHAWGWGIRPVPRGHKADHEADSLLVGGALEVSATAKDPIAPTPSTRPPVDPMPASAPPTATRQIETDPEG